MDAVKRYREVMAVWTGMPLESVEVFMPGLASALEVTWDDDFKDYLAATVFFLMGRVVELRLRAEKAWFQP